MQVKVKVERVLYPREGQEGDWFIIQADVGICKGKMRWRPEPGERIALDGVWGEYKGSQEFQFKEAWHDLPQDSRALLHYACELTKGIGPATEEAIWEAMGEKWPEIEAGCVSKLRGSVLNSLHETISRLELEKEKTDACAWLISNGATRRMAEAAWVAWQGRTIGVVQGDCYKLAELPNYSFRDVDSSIRRSFGIGDDDPRRVKAAVVYYMRQLASGPTAVPWWALKERVLGAIEVAPGLLNVCVAEMFKMGDLHPFKGSQHVALAADYENELAIWEYLGSG